MRSRRGFLLHLRATPRPSPPLLLSENLHPQLFVREALLAQARTSLSETTPAPAIALVRLVSPHTYVCVSRSAAAHPCIPAEDVAT